MGLHTKIQWCDSTVNPTGFQCCGCELWNAKKGVRRCYAGKFAERVGGRGAFDKPVVLKPGRTAVAARWSDLRGKVRADKPWLNGRRRVIFVGDMADVLQPRVLFNYLLQEVVHVASTPPGDRHTWMLLTKQSSRLAEFARWLEKQGISWPDNLWPGITVTDNLHTYRVPDLLRVKSDHRWVSYEPACGAADFSQWLWTAYKDDYGLQGFDPSYAIRMLIVGGESGPSGKQYPFNVAWVRELLETCEDARVDLFIKQLGSCCVIDDADCEDWPEGTKLVAHGNGFAARAVLQDPKGGDWNEWPEKFRVRQFPDD